MTAASYARAARRLALAAFALGALSACEPALSLGAGCVRASDCELPLRCVLGRCRSECLSDVDCIAGARCVRADATSSVCTVEAEERCTTGVCPAPLMCVDGQCRNTCGTGAECVSGATCVGGSCVGSSGDAGMPDGGTMPRSCARHADCGSGGVCQYGPGAGTCVPACIPGTCPADSHCLTWVDLDGASADGCSPACVPGTRDGCAAAMTCTMGSLSRGPEAGPATMCRPIGSDPEGCTCSDGGYAVSCADGLVCVRGGAVPYACVVPCALGTTCASGVDCTPFDWPISVGGVVYGICPITERTATGCSLPPPP